MQVAAAPIEGTLFEAIGRSILEGAIEARDMVFFLRLRPLWRVLSEQETWALLRQVIWILEVTRDGTIGHIGFDTVMIDVLVAEEPTFFANLPPRFGSGRLDRVLGHALLRMRARGAFGPHGAASTRDDEFESWVDLDYAEGRAAMRGTRRLRDNGFVLRPVLARMPEDSERGRS